MSFNFCHYIVCIDNDNIKGFIIKYSDNSVNNIILKRGYYLGFVEKDFLVFNIENQFSELLYDSKIILVRHKDIMNSILKITYL